jgi:hypothetical protein
MDLLVFHSVPDITMSWYPGILVSWFWSWCPVPGVRFLVSWSWSPGPGGPILVVLILVVLSWWSWSWSYPGGPVLVSLVSWYPGPGMSIPDVGRIMCCRLWDVGRVGDIPPLMCPSEKEFDRQKQAHASRLHDLAKAALKAARRSSKHRRSISARSAVVRIGSPLESY